MAKTHWHEHPGVRTGSELAFRERAAELLKNAMGTWSALGLSIGGISGYWALAKDPGHLNLNIALSLVAALQGIILQIALNRGDRIASELAMHDHKLLMRICNRLGICDHPECQELEGEGK